MEDLKALLYDIDKDRTNLGRIHDLIMQYVAGTQKPDGNLTDLLIAVRMHHGQQDSFGYSGKLFEEEMYNGVLRKAVIDALIKLCK